MRQPKSWNEVRTIFLGSTWEAGAEVLYPLCLAGLFFVDAFLDFGLNFWLLGAVVGLGGSLLLLSVVNEIQERVRGWDAQEQNPTK